MLSRLLRTQSEPTPTKPPKEELAELISAHRHRDETFLTESCLSRYLTARSNDPQKAVSQLLETLSWRESYSPSTLHTTHLPLLRKAADTGKMFVLPHPDRHGRAVIIMRPGLENQPHASVDNIRYLVYTLERASLLAEQGGGDCKFVVVVDFFSGKISVTNSPGVAVMKESIAILQGHYPERLAGLVFFQAPMFFYGLFRVVKPFIDPVTRDKLRFAKQGVPLPQVEFLDPATLPTQYGGELEYEFDVDSYFKEHPSG